MTLYCNQCKNQGFYLISQITKVSWEGDNPNGIPSDREHLPLFVSPFQTVKKYCDCDYGKRLQILDNQMAHPEYENPLARLTDDELINLLDEGSSDLRAIEQEFQ